MQKEVVPGGHFGEFGDGQRGQHIKVIYAQPERDHKMLLAQLGWELPPQSPPRITQKGQLQME